MITGKAIIQHELDLFFRSCMEHMHDTEEDWDYVIDWSRQYAVRRGNSPEIRELLLERIERLERKFGHKNVGGDRSDKG